MQAESLISLYYTLIHIAPFDLLVFYIFRRQLRWRPLPTILGYSLLLLTEWTLQLKYAAIYDQHISLLFQLVYAAYDLCAIREYPLKLMAIGFLTVPLELVAYSLASFADASWPLRWPYLTGCLTITAVYLLALAPMLHYIRHELAACLTIEDRQPWNYVFAYETLLILTTLCIDPFNESAGIRVFLSRLCLLIADIIAIRIMVYLHHSIQSREYTSHLLNSVQSLQLMEHRRYRLVMDAWYASRRMRHDLKHHLLTIEAMLDAGDYTGLKIYLDKTVKAFTATRP